EASPVEGGGGDHGVGLVQRLDLEMRVGADGEESAGACRADEELGVGHAVALVDLDRDAAFHAEIDQPLLPLLGVHAFGIAERLQCGERGMAEDVDAIALDPLRDHLERALEETLLKLRIPNAIALVDGIALSL